MIDTLKAQEAGFTKEQIEVLRELESEAIRTDLVDVKLRLERVESKLVLLLWIVPIGMAMLGVMIALTRR